MWGVKKKQRKGVGNPQWKQILGLEDLCGEKALKQQHKIWII